MAAPKNRFNKKPNLFTVNFIDGSGEYKSAIVDVSFSQTLISEKNNFLQTLSTIRSIYFDNFGDYVARRHVLAGN